MRRVIPFIVFCILLFSFGKTVQAASAAASGYPPERNPALVLQSFLGTPYRTDGVLNDRNQYATFNAPDTVFTTPGLNCSGLVLAASRKILGKEIPLQNAVHDRLGDSMPGSSLGQDWDFGFDFILNIAEGTKHSLLLPSGAKMPENLTGQTVPGFDLHAPQFAKDLLPRIREGYFYLVSFSRHKTPDSPAHLHYHTGIIVREGKAVWSYSTTHTSRKVIRLNIASPEGLATFRQSFRNLKNSYKHLNILEITPVL